MKQESTNKKKKLWIWLIVGAVVLVTILGVGAFLLFGQGEPDGKADIYWNVDRKTYMEDSPTGLSTREKGEDGLYHITFALDGEQVELSVESKRLVDRIDLVDTMGLVLGEDGTVVDIVEAETIAVMGADQAYVRCLEDGVLTVNPSPAMDGEDLRFDITEGTGIYDCRSIGEDTGKPGTIQPMDVLRIYQNDLGQATHVFITGRMPDAQVYWRVEQFFDPAIGQSVRSPGADGAYTVRFAADGEQVELKCKDRGILNAIDGKSGDSCAFGFTFDEEGYITGILDPGMAIKGAAYGATMEITGATEDTVTVDKLMPGNGQGYDYQCVITENTRVYDVSATAAAVGEAAQLRVGDSLFVLTDTKGQAQIAYITNRAQDGGEEIVTQGKAVTPVTQWDSQVLSQRRDLAEDYMRKQVSLLWRAEEDITYITSRRGVTDLELANSDELIHIKKGRIYSGVIYVYSYTTMSSFLEYAGQADENGVYPISGISYEIISGGSNATRMGNDCSSAVVTAWSQFGTSVTGTYSRYYLPSYGFIPLGNFVPLDGYGERGTSVVIENNDPDVMYESYARLQKADTLVRQNTNGNHAMMVVSVNVVRNSDYSIDPVRSTVTILEQTSSNVRSGATREDPVLGKVYLIGGVDVEISFEKLLKSTYLPYTCPELRSASEVAEAEVTDTLSDHNLDNLFEGTISSNWFIGSMNIVITDKDGKQVQKAALNALRTNPRVFEMRRFVTDDPKAIRGGIDLTALAAGEYHCSVICRLSTEEEFTVREFDFTK